MSYVSAFMSVLSKSKETFPVPKQQQTNKQTNTSNKHIKQPSKRPQSAPLNADKRSEFGDRPPFKPSNPTPSGKYLGYPEYLVGTLRKKPASKKQDKSNQDEVPPWKPNHNGYSHFIRTVALNKKNLGWRG